MYFLDEKYPFKIRAREPEIEKVLDELARDNFVIVNTKKEKNTLTKVGYLIEPIRNDFHHGWDRRDNSSSLSMKKKIKIEKKGKDFIFFRF